MNIHLEHNERLYPVGYKFMMPKRGKREEREAEVVDHAFTFNSQGKLVQMRYHVAEKYIMGQRLMNYDVTQVAIDRATDNGWKDLI
tara:strand:- start:474 stop:731 length:258 start_codon:yes stop_codon:yes gene_type:complete